MIIDKHILDELTAKAKTSPRLRMNLDLRNSESDQSQRFKYCNWLKHNKKLLNAGAMKEVIFFLLTVVECISNEKAYHTSHASKVSSIAA